MQPTIVTVPCFSGAPWDLETLHPLERYRLRTMRLPEGLDDIERYADFVLEQISGLDDVVLVGDSFGAVVSIGVAARRPRALRGLVLSGGFAANPVTSPLLKARIGASRLMPGALYKAVTLRFHAASLASPFDMEGEVAWPPEKSRDLFVQNTPHQSYVARARAAFSADYLDRLHGIAVPTLILTPENDKLIGPDAARLMEERIPDAREVVVPRTGHMFRFSHPETYAREVASFIERCVLVDRPALAG